MSMANYLEEAAWEYASKECEKDAFIAGAKWQKEQDDKELSDLLTIAHLQGAEQMKEQMMVAAVEGIVENWSPEPHPEITIPLNPEEYSNGDKVCVIIIKKEDGK